MEQKFQGVIAVVLTHFDKDEKINYSALERLIEFLLSKGEHGLFPCGSFSLEPLMISEKRKKLLGLLSNVIDF